jgi:hypothetical protein
LDVVGVEVANSLQLQGTIWGNNAKWLYFALQNLARIQRERFCDR